MFKTHFWKLARTVLVALTISGCAFAQYGGGSGGGMAGSGGTSRSYGHGAVIGAVAGAAAGAAVLYFVLHHHHQQVVGCTGSDAKTLTADKGKQTYQLSGTPLIAGEHVSVLGKKIKNDSGIDELQVMSVKKDLGQCEQQAELVEQHP